MLILISLNFWDVSRNLVNMNKYTLIPKKFFRIDLVLTISVFFMFTMLYSAIDGVDLIRSLWRSIGIPHKEPWIK